MSPYRLTRADRFGIAVPCVMATALVVSVALGAGDAGSRAALGLTTTATAVSVSAPFADRDATREEDSPRWDCYTDGNRLCARFHGPTR